MSMPGSPSIEKNPVRWNSSLSGSYESMAAIGVLAGIAVALTRMPIHLPGHKILLWVIPVLAARIVTRSHFGASIGALTTAITALCLGGRPGGGIALLPLIIPAGAVLDAAAQFVHRRYFAVWQRIPILGSAGLIANMICFLKRLFDPAGQLHSAANVNDLLIAASSHAFCGFLAGILGATAGYALLTAAQRIQR